MRYIKTSPLSVYVHLTCAKTHYALYKTIYTEQLIKHAEQGHVSKLLIQGYGRVTPRMLVDQLIKTAVIILTA